MKLINTMPWAIAYWQLAS